MVPGFRQRFGPLRAFVERFCADHVNVLVAPELGGDALFESKFPAATDRLPTPKPLTGPDPAWRAFTVPDSGSNLYVNGESGEIQVRLKADPELAQPWHPVPSATAEDHRKIATDFLGRVDPEDQPAFEDILKLPQFWHPWAMKLRAHQQGKYSQPWIAFRFEQLCALYLARIKSAGVPEDLAARSLTRLKALKSASRVLAKPTALNLPVATPSGLSIRKLALAALESMTEDDLRQVWLPLGAVADAIAKCQPR